MYFDLESHPTWVRGLKYQLAEAFRDIAKVAPHVGAWIEILLKLKFYPKNRVAPHVGAWIEIELFAPRYVELFVAPHVGAWIEIVLT